MTTSHAISDANTNIDTNTKNNVPKIAIIGGGLTGLMTATLLERAFKDNINITIFEKSRSVGRLATRYRTDETSQKNWQWAFGAQFFVAKQTDFQDFITPFINNDILQPWQASVVNLTPNADAMPDISHKEDWDNTHPRYISTPKMTTWGRTLADNLKQTTITFKTRVAPLQQKTAGQTELFADNGENLENKSLGHFDWVICTAPNGQAVDLMADSGFSAQDKICAVKMQACYTLMLGWDALESMPESVKNEDWDVAYITDKVLDRAFIEHNKSGRNILPSITIHARNDWSDVHVDDDIESIKTKLLAATKNALNWNNDSMPTQIDCHRWRYAATAIDKKEEPLGILVDDKNQWVACGDWCYQGNIESCYRAAAATVEAIIGKSELDDSTTSA